MPAGWLSGAIVGVSAAALAGRPMFVPPQVGRAVYVILGISLGSSVTPETVATMVTWPLSMLALTIAMIAVTISVMAYLKFVHGWHDALDALFAAAPGALAQAMALAQDTGANVRADRDGADRAAVHPRGRAAADLRGLRRRRPAAAARRQRCR